MECCLCQAHTDFDNYIAINSPQWFNLNVLSTIEKHFWQIDNLQSIFGVCQWCWSKLNDFHTFYISIEDAHRRDTKISVEESNNTRRLDMAAFELRRPCVLKTDLPSPEEESNFTIDDLKDSIKIKEYLNEDESLLCAMPTEKRGEMECNPISPAKRKRGRPRKKHDLNTTLMEKPKGKRGRPRKDNIDMTSKTSSIIVKQTMLPSKVHLMHDSNHIHETLHQTAFGKAKVKRGRGRPRKTEANNETPNTIRAVVDVAMPDTELVIDKQDSTVQNIDRTKNVSLNFNDPHKKKLYSFIKKRRRIQQHKALMRNYIATSVRCMKFVKK